MSLFIEAVVGDKSFPIVVDNHLEAAELDLPGKTEVGISPDLGGNAFLYHTPTAYYGRARWELPVEDEHPLSQAFGLVRNFIRAHTQPPEFVFDVQNGVLEKLPQILH